MTFSYTGESAINKKNNFNYEGPKYGKDSAKCVINLSLYREFYKQKNYDDAISSWRWVFLNCPLASENTYIHGINIVKYMYKKEKDPDKKEKLVDTLMMVYNQRIEYFGKQGYILGRKGVDLFILRPKSFEEVNNILKKSIELQGNKSKASVLNYYFKTTIELVNNKKADTSLIIDNYNKINDIVEYNINNNLKDSAYYNQTKLNIENLFNPYATCKNLINIYSKKFKENPKDIELLKKITTVLNKKECTENSLFFEATEALNKLHPSAESACLMGKMCSAKKLYQKSAEYLLEAIKLFEREEDKADSYLLLADIYKNLKQYPLARSYAYKAAKIRTDDGRPYLLIGDMYAASSKLCNKDELEEKAVYWIAVDKYNKAKNIDSSLESIVNKKINIYRQHFPNNETVFFYNFKKGDSYTVGCWINEITTVR
jgi:tetratricopeptide (TPR) repeat protein